MKYNISHPEKNLYEFSSKKDFENCYLANRKRFHRALNNKRVSIDFIRNTECSIDVSNVETVYNLKRRLKTLPKDTNQILCYVK